VSVLSASCVVTKAWNFTFNLFRTLPRAVPYQLSAEVISTLVTCITCILEVSVCVVAGSQSARRIAIF
jgi:hypothetical protein